MVTSDLPSSLLDVLDKDIHTIITTAIPLLDDVKVLKFLCHKITSVASGTDTESIGNLNIIRVLVPLFKRHTDVSILNTISSTMTSLCHLNLFISLEAISYHALPILMRCLSKHFSAESPTTTYPIYSCINTIVSATTTRHFSAVKKEYEDSLEDQSTLVSLFQQNSDDFFTLIPRNLVINASQKPLSRLDSMLSEASTSTESLQAKVDELEEKISKVKYQQLRIGDDISQVEASIAELDSLINNGELKKSRDLSALLTSIEKQSVLLESVNVRLESLKKRYSGLKNSDPFSVERSKKKNLIGSLDELISSSNTLNSQLSDLVSSRDSFSSQLISLKDGVSNVRESRSAFCKRVFSILNLNQSKDYGIELNLDCVFSFFDNLNNFLDSQRLLLSFFGFPKVKRFPAPFPNNESLPEAHPEVINSFFSSVDELLTLFTTLSVNIDPVNVNFSQCLKQFLSKKELFDLLKYCFQNLTTVLIFVHHCLSKKSCSSFLNFLMYLHRNSHCPFHNKDVENQFISNLMVKTFGNNCSFHCFNSVFLNIIPTAIGFIESLMKLPIADLDFFKQEFEYYLNFSYDDIISLFELIHLESEINTSTLVKENRFLKLKSPFEVRIIPTDELSQVYILSDGFLITNRSITPVFIEYKLIKSAKYSKNGSPVTRIMIVLFRLKQKL
ncbi:hypothetical protein P9112_002516 [Eukaryota sp. TZLM1-RC]